MFPDKRLSLLSKQSQSNYYKLLRDIGYHPYCLVLGAGASATVGLPTWSLLLKKICYCYFEQWASKIPSGALQVNRPPSNVSIALTESYDYYLLTQRHPEILDVNGEFYKAEYWINGRKLSTEEAEKENQKMIESDLFVQQTRDAFMQKILSCDLTLTAQMIKSHVRPKDWDYLIRKSLYSSYEDEPYVLEVSPLYNALIQLQHKYEINSIINYNYDDTYYHAMLKSGIRFENCYNGISKQGKRIIFYPHGYIPMKGGAVTNIVLSEDDYQQQIYHQNSWANNVQMSTFMSNTCIFIGLSLTDSNLRRILNMGSDSSRYSHYAFLPSTGAEQADIMYDSLFDADLYRLGIRVIRYPADKNHKELANLIDVISSF